MVKLLIQIPALNEAATLGQTLSELPRSLPGVDQIQVLVVDDGSHDATAEIARAYGADVFSFPARQGLARVFATALRLSLERGADVIVHTDADNQYPARFIPALIQPVLDGKADMVIGARPIERIRQFSTLKKILQVVGSAVVRLLSGVDVVDAPSGFRAYSREAALRLTIVSGFTYTLETLLQAKAKGLTVTSVPIEVNTVTRPSRLFKNIPIYLARSFSTIVRIQLLYHPMELFMIFYAASLLVWIWACLVFDVSLIFLVLWTLLCLMAAYISDLLACNRRLHEEGLYYLRRQATLHTSGDKVK